VGSWKETVENPLNLRIYREEIKDRIPDEILDFHIHIFNDKSVPLDDRGFELPGVFIREYTVSELKNDLNNIYPGKKCRGVIFGLPDKKYNHEVNNDYILENSDLNELYPLRLVKPDESPELLKNELIKSKFLGIKPYPDYVSWKNVEDVEIFDMVPHEHMEIVNSLGLIVMLHIPRNGRLADPLNQKQLVELAINYPKAKIVIAHIGRAYYLKNIMGNIEKIAPYENIYCDITMVNNWEVMEYLFNHFDHSRILYGTDIPIGLCGGKSVEINDQYTYVTSKPWKLSISDDHNKLIFTSFIYEEIRAILKAIERCGLRESFVESLFFKNGMFLLNEVKQKKPPDIISN